MVQNDDPSYICGQCGDNFITENQCNEHLESHLFTCYKCEFKCNTKKELSSHESKKHKLLGCDKPSGTISDEIPKYDTNESFMCEYCGKPFIGARALKEHECTHSIQA